ncbi:glycoside hydrolase family 108 protein [Paraburkholderia diazotrophica]|uniref:Predicted Peptidoglycan domain-containing protein n=1 Tax=Paraburkholderia diazotrophica TaxID=667676 RepID=A0A1H7EKI4_9BURK|nr:glycosyl hydrolase 108 family protein [Paraburkholderia diazotrophica]SEK11205.1 Predicted Peptidoglycan domain-containing protein [Paraburkholderia diazotrophica]
MATHHGHPHHPAAPAAPASPPPPQWQPLNWSFPFAPVSGNEADPQTWLSSLANSDGGFYPLGSNGMYHGGIHFDAGTGGKLKQGDGVRAIADGEVVAYRLDSTYPELTYPTTPPRYALYSTGFVLIRHRLVLPPEPDKQGTSSTAATAASGASATTASSPQAYQPPADEVLEFYSLYMHQLDWKGYQDARTGGGNASASSIHSLPFWQGDKHFRVGGKANDRQAQLRQLDPTLNFGSPSGLLNEATLAGGTLSGPAPDSMDTLSTYPDKVRYTVPPASPADASQNAGTPQTGVHICDHANGTVIGLLPRGGELSVVGNVAKGWALIATITKGIPVAAIAGGTPDPRAATGWVNLDELDAVIDPKPLDAVVVLDKPFPVKAGDVVGYLGEYQDPTEASMLPPKREHPLLHVEVFAGAQIKNFIGKSQERAKKLPDKPLLLIQQGAKLVKPADPQSNDGLKGLTLALATGKQGDPGKGLWAKVQPTKLAAQPSTHGRGHNHNHPASGTPVGDPLWVERTKYAGKVASGPVPTWAAFPLQLANAEGPAVGYQQVFPRAQLDEGREIDRATDDQGTQWWSITAGDDEGRTITRWVCEKNHPDTLWESPWAWPGFDTVDTTSIPLLDMYRRNLFEAKRLIEGDDEKEFSTVAATVNAGQFIGKLEKAAKRQGDGKGNVVPADLRNALTVRWLAEAVSHVIFRYESEWGGDMGKWEKFLPLMGELGKPTWTTEMERIKKLQWWDKVKAVKDFPADPDVWHMHPIGLLGNFFQNSTESCDCAAPFKKISKIILRHEGGYVNRSDDKGGPTNHGIAWSTWQKYAEEDVGVAPTLDNLKKLMEQQAEAIYLKRYWQPKGYCGFKDERVALMSYDWSITSGGAALQIQKLLNQKYHSNLVEDGGMGKQTVNAINAIPDQEALLQDIASIRRRYYTNLTIKDPGQIGNLKGWLNRVNDCLQVQV